MKAMQPERSDLNQSMIGPRVQEVLTLENDHLSFSFAPRIGASMLGLALKSDGQVIQVMRECAIPAGATLPKSSSDCASFIMAPYPNRIRDGAFTFDGVHHQLRYPEKHAIHGDVRNRPWEVLAVGGQEAVLQFKSPAFSDINFPFPFDCALYYRLDDSTLHTDFFLTNTGDSDMPAGVGFHPYFRRSLVDGEEVKLQFRVRGAYPFRGEVPLPEGPPRPLLPSEDYSTLRILDSVLDHCFCGWHGAAIFEWPKSRVRLELQADAPLNHLVVYSPAGKDFFAVEPQSQMIDGVNFIDRPEYDTGVAILPAGQKLSASFALTLSQS